MAGVSGKGFGRWLLDFDKRARQEVEKSPVFYITIALAMLAVLLFRNALEFLLEGFVFLPLGLLVITLAFLLLVKKRPGKMPLKKLLREKKVILTALDVAKKRYMRRKLSEESFNSIFREKQKRLIEIEALIGQQADSKGRKLVDQKLLAVRAKKRHFLKAFLEEKSRLVRELELAEKGYLRRKIDASTYKGLVEENQKRLVELDAGIVELYSEANISKIMKRLKKRLAKLEGLKKRKPKTGKEEIIRIVDEVAEQASKK